MATLLLQSAQSLLIEMAFGQQALGTGTAFVVQSRRGPMLITNRHNVTGRRQDNNQPLSPTGGVPDRLRIVHNQKDKPGNWVVREEELNSAVGVPRWHEHPRLGAIADFVALPLTRLDDCALYPYDPGNPGPDVSVGPSDTVSVVGFPFGVSAGGALAIWATGFVASEPEVDFDGKPLFLVDCRTRPGQSGSAVIAHRNGGMVAMRDGSAGVFNGPVTRFLGIYSGRINNESDLGLVWKASAIQELVAGL
jgi:hypothetical protein